MTTEDFLRPTRSCAEEQKPLKLVVFACRSFPMRQEEVNPVSPVSTQLSETSSTLRSLAPVALLACLKGMYCSGRLSAGVLASLALQFLPILAQRVSRKQEKINRKGAKFRKGPVLQLLRSLCQQLEAIPGSHHACEALHGYVSGTDTGHLGDGLAELLRCLAACKSRTRLATALVAVADEVLRVLPFLFPGTFGSASSKPCAAWAAALVGAPVHGGFTCAACHLTPIVGPRFESLAPDRSQSLCGECFTKDSLQGRAEEHDFSCRLAPEDYDAAAALDDSLCDGGMDAQMGFNSQTSGIFHTGPLLAEAFSPWPIGPAVQVAQMLSSAATFTSTPAAGLSALYGVVHNVGQSGMDRLLSQDSENGLSHF